MSISGFLWRFPSVQMAWRNLGRNRVRTGLAVLGILIGVVAIASIGMAGAAIQQQAASNLESITNEVIVRSGEDNDTPGLTDDQVEEIRSLVGDARVVPQKSNVTEVTARSGAQARVSVTGLTQASVLYNASSGQVPSRLQSGALLSAETASRLGLDIGDPIEYEGRLYRIVALLEEDDGFGGGGNELVLPLSAMSDQQYYDSATVVAENGDEAEATADSLETAFNSRPRGDDEDVLNVRSFAGVQEQIGSFLTTLNRALLGIGAISLLVASIAILNVMLMSTVERRGEIGVLRAVGVRRYEVLRMILAEAAFLGVFGGLIGCGIALAIGLVLFEVLLGDPLLVFAWESARYLLLGFVFAVMASLVSGIYPAMKAANDPPVESLRG